jgi:WD40 repeat protein
MPKPQRICFALPAILLLATLASLSPAGGEKTSPHGVLATLKGHSELVYTVAFSKDGKQLVTGSFDNTIKLWDVAAGKEIKTFGGPAGHQKMVLSVAFSPDSRSIASGGADNTLKLWDIPTTSPLRTLAANDAVSALGLSADGTKLATGSKTGGVKLWTAAEFKELFNMSGHTGAVTSVAFSANGQTLVSSGADRTLRFWNVANGQLIAVVGAHAGSANSVVFNPNNTVAYSGGEDGFLKFWQVPPPAAKPLPAHAAPLRALAQSVDGNQIATAGDDKIVRISALATAKEARALTGPAAPITSVAFAANAAFVAAGTADERLFLWSNTDGKVVDQAVAHHGAVTGVSFHPQNTQLLTSGQDGLIKLWALPPVPARVLAHPDGVLATVMSGDGKRFFTGGVDKIVRSWDLAKKVVERQFTGHTAPVTAVATSGNGQILVSGSADATIRFWNQTTSKEAENLGGHTAAVTALALNPAGTQLLSASEDRTLKLWQLPIVAPKALVHPDQVTSLALSADGSKLLTGGADKQARLWNVSTGAKEKDYTGPTLAITSVALSSDGKFAAAGSADKTLTVWNASDAKAMQKVTLPAIVQAVAFSPDGKNLAAGLADNTIKLINPVDGKEVKSLGGHKVAVTGLLYSPKGELVSVSADKTVQLWNLDGSPKSKLDHPAPITALALTRDGARLAAAGEKTIKVWSLADGKELATLTVPAEVRGLAFAPDGGRLAVGGTDKMARLYDLAGKLVESFVHEGPVTALVYVDAKRVVSASADKMARVWTSSLVWQQAQGGPVRQAVFSPKGDQVLSAGNDKTLRVLNAADGKELKSFAAHDGAVIGLGVSADGTRVATASDKVVKVWGPNVTALDEKKPLAVFTLPAGAHGIALSPNGQRLAVGLSEGTAHKIRVFDVPTSREVQVFADHTAAIKSLAFQPDNRTLISASLDKNVRLTAVGVLAALEAHPGGTVGVHFHGNGTQAVTAGADRTVKLWDLGKATVIKTLGPVADPIKNVAFNRDFTQVGVAAGKTAKVWNLADGKEVLSLVHPAEVLSLSFSVDKSKIVTGAADKLTRVWDAAGGKELQFFFQEGPVEAVVFDPKNNAVVSAGGKTSQLDILAVTRSVPAASGAIHAVAIAPNGNQLFTAAADKSVKQWNAASGAAEKTFPVGMELPRALAVSKNNALLAVGTEQAVHLFNVADTKVLGAVKVPPGVRAIAFSPNNQALAAACADKSVLTWDITFTANQPLPPDFLKPIQGFAHTEGTTDIAFGLDNATIYSASLDKTVQAWRMASPAPTKNFPHPNNVDSVAFHPSGTTVATGCHDGKVRLFDLVKGVQLREINAHTTANATMIYVVAFSPDGKQVLSGSYDNSLKLWDTAGGNLVREFKAFKAKDFEKGHQDSVFSAAFSPDGKFLASGSGGLERTIKIWNVADGSVVRDLANPTLKAPAPMMPPHSHPGWVYQLRFTGDGKYLISAGDAPLNKGYLAVWNPLDGKMVYGEALPLGTFFGLAIAPDNKTLAVGAGPRGRPTPEFNSAYLLKMPPVEK